MKVIEIKERPEWAGASLSGYDDVAGCDVANIIARRHKDDSSGDDWIEVYWDGDPSLPFLAVEDFLDIGLPSLPWQVNKVRDCGNGMALYQRVAP